MNTATHAPPTWHERWQRFSAASVRAFHAYATWLVGISWWRFFALSLLLIVVMAIVHDAPPFTWTLTERIEGDAAATPPAVPRVPRVPRVPSVVIEPGAKGGSEGVDINISINEQGIVIKPGAAAKAASAASAAASAASAAASAARGTIQITLPPGPAADAVREALAEAQREFNDAISEARADAAQAREDARQALADAIDAAEVRRPALRITRFGIGDFLMQFTLLWVFASAILKFTYKGRVQAEVKAAQAEEVAEAESLKRQVVEARMAAMQAQVEPHFLFNTLASIDHLIETDPARASVMQKNLIALLRASMPTLREAGGNGGNGAGGANGGVRELAREIAVIKPYLEILRVRMEERLTTEIAVPEGLMSAEFPPMMIQTLVENAIKHGLEPKPEGGHLRVAADVVHGKLQVTVADTGLGFGKAATAGTGVGLANIRERLQLLYGNRAALAVAESPGGGTVVTVTVPYKAVEGATQ